MNAKYNNRIGRTPTLTHAITLRVKRASKGSLYTKAAKSLSLKDKTENARVLQERLKKTTTEESVSPSLVTQGLRDAFNRQRMTSKEKDAWDEQAEKNKALMNAAKCSGLLFEDVFDAYKNFEYVDYDRSGKINCEQFCVAVVRLLQLETRGDLSPERLRQVCLTMWMDTEQDESERIDFLEFLKWFELYQYKAVDAFMTDSDRHLLDLAQRYKVSLQDVQLIKFQFDKKDTERLGYITYEDFKDILDATLKLSDDLVLPDARVQTYWREMTSGVCCEEVNFENFLHWWLLHGGGIQAYEDFYRRIRMVSTREARWAPKPAAVKKPSLA